MLHPTDVILKCALTGSTNEKVAFLKEHESDLLKKCLNYGLDPYKVFGIKKFEFREPAKAIEGADNWPILFDCCDKLMNREITGDSARAYILKCSGFLLAKQQQMLEWILDKDFRAGIAEGLVNKAFPKLIPTFEVQLAQPEKFFKKVKYPCMVQPKLDGVRTIAIVIANDKTVTYFSRNGKEFKNFKCFDEALLKLACGSNKVFDGEVVGPPGDNFRGIMTQVQRKYDVEPKGLNYRVFDWLPLHHFVQQNCSLDQTERTDALYEMWVQGLDCTEGRVAIVDSLRAHDEKELEMHYQYYVSEGFEGIIIKDLHGEYEFKRTDAWVKMKPDATEDLKVVDVQEGTGKYSGLLGALVVERNGVKINVGSGFKDEERCEFEEAQSFIGKIVEVKYDSVTPDGSLRFPRFIKIREDK